MNTIESAYGRFSTTRFPLPSEEQLVAIEKRIEVRFPDDYRGFLRQYNGGYFSEPDILPVDQGCPEDSLAFMCGINASHPEAELGRATDLALFDDNVPPKIVPIGCTPLGSFIILDTSSGESRGTILLKQAFGDFYFLADGIQQFFELLRAPSD